MALPVLQTGLRFGFLSLQRYKDFPNTQNNHVFTLQNNKFLLPTPTSTPPSQPTSDNYGSPHPSPMQTINKHPQHTSFTNLSSTPQFTSQPVCSTPHIVVCPIPIIRYGAYRPRGEQCLIFTKHGASFFRRMNMSL